MSIRAVDVHTHVVPETFPASAGSSVDPRWPSMRKTDACHAQVIISGKVYRTVDDGCWSVTRRAEAMAEMAIDHQVLSPMPELLGYWLPAAVTVALADHVNAEIARMVALDPLRFSGLGMVPLQDPELAAEKLVEIVDKYALAGVEIGTNINGKPIGSPEFDVFFAAAEELGVPVLVHALHPAGRDRLVGPVSEQIAAFPGETALAIVSMMTGGLLARRPLLKIGFCHGGGAFAINLPRLEQAWRTTPALRDPMPQPPRHYARKIFYDDLVYDERTLRFLIDSFGATQIMIGTDYPFGVMEREPVRFLNSPLISDTERDLIRGANAKRFLLRGASRGSGSPAEGLCRCQISDEREG